MVSVPDSGVAEADKGRYNYRIRVYELVDVGEIERHGPSRSWVYTI